MAEIGGVTTFVRQLRESLSNRGHKVLLLEPGDSDRITPLTAGEREQTYEIYLRGMYVPGAAVKSFVAFWVYLLLTLHELWTFLKRKQIQIVHLHFPTPHALYFSLLRFFSPWRLVV
ncbi:MAG: glycosyltransferase family 4 protein, partial [Thermoplasmata archaeon]